LQSFDFAKRIKYEKLTEKQWTNPKKIVKRKKEGKYFRIYFIFRALGEIILLSRIYEKLTPFSVSFAASRR